MAEWPIPSEEVAKPSGLEVFENMDAFELLDDYEKFSSSIRLSFAKFSTGYKIHDFDNFIREYVGQDQLESIGRLKFPNEWFMKVKSQELREKLLRIGRVRINERCCWLSPLSQKEVRGKVHWLPSTIANDKLKAVLLPFGQIIFIEVEGHPSSCAASTAQSDVRYFSLFLKSGKTAEDLPHFCNIDGFTGLFIIRGRAPACFTCHEIGHKKDECKWYLKKRDAYCNREPRIDGPRVRRRGKRHKKKKSNATPKSDAAVATAVSLPGKQISSEKDGNASCSDTEGQRKKRNPKVAKSDAATGTSLIFPDNLTKCEGGALSGSGKNQVNLPSKKDSNVSCGETGGQRKKRNPEIMSASAIGNHTLSLIDSALKICKGDAHSSSGKNQAHSKKPNVKMGSETASNLPDTPVNQGPGNTSKINRKKTAAGVNTPINQSQRNNMTTSKVDAATGTMLSFSNKPIQSEEGAGADCDLNAGACSPVKPYTKYQNKNHSIMVHHHPYAKSVPVQTPTEGSTSRNKFEDGKNRKVSTKDAGTFPISHWSSNERPSEGFSTQKAFKEQQSPDCSMENFVETLQRSASAIKALESQLSKFKFNPTAPNNGFAGPSFQEHCVSAQVNNDSADDSVEKTEEARGSIPTVSEGNDEEKKSKSRKKKNKKKKKV